MHAIWEFFRTIFNRTLVFPDMSLTDIIEIILIAYLIYHVMVWIKSTKAWTLLKGVAILLLFALIAVVFEFNTIIWLAEKFFAIGIIAIIVMFQPELRKALEQLGRKNIINIKGFMPLTTVRILLSVFRMRRLLSLQKRHLHLPRPRPVRL